VHKVEADILTIISNTGRDILEDDAAIDTLRAAQRRSAAIEAAIAAAEKTEQQIQQFKARFRSVAECTALLGGCVADFRALDPIDQFSLPWLVSLFRTADHPPDHQTAVTALNRQVLPEFHESVSFLLFTRYKLLFSTFLAVRTLATEKCVSPAELAALVAPQPDPTRRGCPRTRGSARKPSPTRHRRSHRSSTTST
jgi:dynein heavy chain